MAVNAQGGILVQNTNGPRTSAQRNYPTFPDYEIPTLEKLSDMMWAMWEYYVPENQRSGINFFLSLAIDNALSKTLIRRALDSQGVALSQTPTSFDPTSDGGLALLGTY
jgi:hypothetical protein